MTEFEALLRLNMTQGIGIRTYKTLLERFGSSEAILEASMAELEAVPGIGPKLANAVVEESKTIDIGAEIDLAREKVVQILPYTSEQYPKHLKTIYDPPIVLYVRGNILETDIIALAIVGVEALHLLWVIAGGTFCPAPCAKGASHCQRHGTRYRRCCTPGRHELKGTYHCGARLRTGSHLSPGKY